MVATEREYADRFWSSADGLQLHYRDYPGREDRPPLLCLPGLTRNARDFEPVAEHFAGDWRIICVELRGRGDSEYAKDWRTYNPLTYLEDLDALFEQAGLDRFVALGTSLGGILTMLLANRQPERIVGALLNDIGPVIDPEGLARIRNYVGQARSFPTWMHAARALEEIHSPAFPHYQISDWLATAKRLMVLGNNDRIVFDYDMKIGEIFNQPAGEAGVDLWSVFPALDGRPVTVLRGELSDILSVETMAEMGRRLPQMEAVTVPGVGHAPVLSEDVSVQAIARLLERIG
jgi:pimeloyl-ACP methyl ester carboxylesterase